MGIVDRVRLGERWNWEVVLVIGKVRGDAGIRWGEKWRDWVGRCRRRMGIWCGRMVGW